MDISNASMLAIEASIEAIFDKKISSALMVYEEKTRILEGRLEELNLQLSESKSEVRSLERQLSERSCQIEHSVRQNGERIAALELNADEQEQYGRRYAVRIEGLTCADGETNDDIRDQVITSLAEVGVEIKPHEIQRLHRSSAPVIKSGRRVAQTIVKFVNWSARRKVHNLNKLLKEKRANFRIHHDLTRQRYALLTDARAKIDSKMASVHGDQEVVRDQNVFPFVDINSNLHARAGKATCPIPTAQALEAFIE